MRLQEIRARLAAVEQEMRGIYDAAAGENRDLEGEALENWNRLDTERRTLAEQQQRAETRDAIDRGAQGRQLENRGDPEGGVSVFGLTREQRMSQFVASRANQAEDRGLSVGRAVGAMLRGDWRHAEGERRAMGSSPASAGGWLLPEAVSANLIDLARNATVLIRAGALTVPMDTPTLRVVQILSDPTAQWRGEGATISESEGTFGALNLTAHSLAALVRVNNELLDDVPSFAATLDNQLAVTLGLELDRVGLYGSGTASQPLGLRYTEGLNEVSMGDNGAAQTDYDDVLDLLQAMEESNGAPSTLIHSPRTKTKLAKLVTGISGDLTKLTPPADYVALAKYVSNQVSITETQGSSNVASTTFVGGFNNMAFAIRQQITIEASRQADDVFAKNQTLVRAIMRADVAVYRPSQLGRLIGVL